MSFLKVKYHKPNLFKFHIVFKFEILFKNYNYILSSQILRICVMEYVYKTFFKNQFCSNFEA